MRNYRPRSNPLITPLHTTSTADSGFTDINSQLSQIQNVDSDLMSAISREVAKPTDALLITQSSTTSTASEPANRNVEVSCPDGSVHIMSIARATSFECPKPSAVEAQPVKMLVLPLTSPGNKTWPIFAGLSLIGVGCWALTRLE